MIREYIENKVKAKVIKEPIEDIKIRAERLYIPGNIYHIIPPTKDNKITTMYEAKAIEFEDIELTINMFTDHLPHRYELYLHNLITPHIVSNKFQFWNFKKSLFTKIAIALFTSTALYFVTKKLINMKK